MFHHSKLGAREPWTQDASSDGKGRFHFTPADPLGGEPSLAPAPAEAFAQMEQREFEPAG